MFHTRQLNDGDVCDAGKPGDRRSILVQCSSKYGSMDTHDSNCTDNIHNTPDIRSNCIDTRGSRTQLRLRPGRQFVLPEPVRVPSRSMKVKEVFSWLSSFDFPFLFWEG